MGVSIDDLGEVRERLEQTIVYTPSDGAISHEFALAGSAALMAQYRCDVALMDALEILEKRVARLEEMVQRNK